MTTDTPTIEQVRDAWDALAPRYDELTSPEGMPFGEDALRRVQIRPGVRFLDVACGSGALAIPAARRGAEVTAVDLAPTMIERLIARASAEGLSGITGRVMNGEALEAEFLGFLLAALHAAVPGFTPPSMDPPPPPMQLADPATLRSVLADAGLTDVRVDTVTWEMPFQSASDFWDVATSGNPITVQLTGDLTAEQVAQARRVSDGMLNERSGGEPGAVLHAEMNIGTGRKP